MAEIHFKATRKRSQAPGFRELTKWGDMAYDTDARSMDGVWLRTVDGAYITIDCDHLTGVFNIKFDPTKFEEGRF